MRSLLLALVVFNLVAYYCHAASNYELYVDPVGGQDTSACNTGSGVTIAPGVACKSIGYAIAPVTSSDFLQVTLLPGTYSGTSNTNIQFKGASINITGAISPSKEWPTIDCEYKATAFTVTPTTKLDFTFANIAVRRCQGSLGGAVSVLGGVNPVTFTNMMFESNHATQSGGAIYSQSYVLNIYSSTFKNNSAVQNGGAVAVQNQISIYVTTSVFRNNTADTGGAIYINNVGSLETSKQLFFFNNNFTDNTVANQGGAFYAKSTDGIVRTYDFYGSWFTDNCATTPYSDSYTVQLRCASDVNCTLSNGNTTGCLGVYKPPPPSDSDDGGKKDKDRAIIIGVVVPFGILAILSVVLFLYIRKRHNKEMSKRDEYRKKILLALDNLPPEEQEAARREADNADPKAPKCQLCETRPRTALPCGHEVVCSVCRTIVLECPVKNCKRPTKG